MNPLHAVSPEDAIGMLIADHKRVANLFADFKRMLEEHGSDEAKAALVVQICRELTVHTQLEEELFYPAVREATQDDDQVDEAVVEHAGAKQLIALLQAASPRDDLYDARVTVLGEQIDHHVEEEEGSMFPKARYAGLDTVTLGATMTARRSEILAGAPPAAPVAPTKAAFKEVKRPPSKKKAAPPNAKPVKSSKKKRR
jgi:hemerythrin superfamily protein